jgi:low temperature requirement protein LtrA
VSAQAAEREQRVTPLARDVYTYLHLPMVAGIVLFAFAMKATLAHVGGKLDTIRALGLCGGPAPGHAHFARRHPLPEDDQVVATVSWTTSHGNR